MSGRAPAIGAMAGAGKTHTMMGSKSDRGVIPRMISQLYADLKAADLAAGAPPPAAHTRARAPRCCASLQERRAVCPTILGCATWHRKTEPQTFFSAEKRDSRHDVSRQLFVNSRQLFHSAACSNTLNCTAQGCREPCLMQFSLSIARARCGANHPS